MTRPERYYDWRHVQPAVVSQPSAVHSGRRMRWLGFAFTLAAALVFGRAAAIVLVEGDNWRYFARKPNVREEVLPALRGRILARDGTVLARDEQVPALAMHYRYLELSSNPAWLRSIARARLSGDERADATAIDREIERVQLDLTEEHRRLAELCGLTSDQWERRRDTICRRVQRIREHVNRAHQQRADAASDRPPLDNERSTLIDRLRWSADRLLTPRQTDRRAVPITVAEELDFHVVSEGLTLDAVAQIESHPERFPGTRIDLHRRRRYPNGELAAQTIGYLGPLSPEQWAELSEANGEYRADDRIGQAGIEQQYEDLLRGERGIRVHSIDRSGRLLSSEVREEPKAGIDLVLSIVSPLQLAAEQLLDEALVRRPTQDGGGAAIVMDVRTGELLAAASAPRFDLNRFAQPATGRPAELFQDERHPMLNRPIQMAIPPGSVFKVVSAIALLESSAIRAEEPFHCRGYLHHPDRWRCQRFVHVGQGHGTITLADALAESCNVYFFHHAAEAGSEPIVDWARRFAFGQPTGVDLTSEAAGTLPTPQSIQDLEGHVWSDADTQALAIGQSSLTVTPLQIARMMAAVANGGRLVTPHVVRGPAIETDETLAASSGTPRFDYPSRALPGLHQGTLDAIRAGLEQAVGDPAGTAHATVFMESLAIGGKTGTAQTGSDGEGRLLADHAWFAGYVPAEAPRYVFVVALEHAGGGATAAGPVARRLVAWIEKLGLVRRRDAG